jgi:hypothetical protein
VGKLKKEEGGRVIKEAKSPHQMQRSKSVLPTWASTAERGSSSK